jgi:hypothetical protein
MPRYLASTSFVWTPDALHDVHLQRCLPALVLPFRFILDPQEGQVFAFIGAPLRTGDFSACSNGIYLRFC